MNYFECDNCIGENDALFSDQSFETLCLSLTYLYDLDELEEHET